MNLRRGHYDLATGVPAATGSGWHSTTWALLTLYQLLRMAMVTAVETQPGTDPHRTWSGQEMAAQLQVKPRNMLTQLGKWASLGFLIRTGRGTYTLATPP